MEKHTLPEEDGHIVSYSVYGNPNGPSILSFHGGPGSSSSLSHAERFDLDTYQVILFDQRGCGESTPLGKTEDNTTQKTLNDAERIREALNIETWFVSGGSWGSTLSLLYAIEHKERVRGLLVSAIYLADKTANNWIELDGGVDTIMPDVREKYIAFLNEHNLTIENQIEGLATLYKEGDEETVKKITAGVKNWEYNLFSPYAGVHYKKWEDITEKDIASSKLYIYYMHNDLFIEDGYILNNVDKIDSIPTIIVHGRYDILCPLKYAKKLADSLRSCQLVIADSSGHSLTPEGKTIQKMAFDRFLTEDC